MGEQGAEQLLGKGDMLFMSSANRIVRIHGPFVSERKLRKFQAFYELKVNQIMLMKLLPIQTKILYQIAMIRIMMNYIIKL